MNTPRYFVSLHTGCPSGNAGSREVKYMNYNRQPLTDGRVTFPANGEDVPAVVTHVGICEADGTLVRVIPVDTPFAVTKAEAPIVEVPPEETWP